MMTHAEIEVHNAKLRDAFIHLVLSTTNATKSGGYLSLRGVTVRVDGRWSTHSGRVTGLRVQVDGCYGYAPKVNYRIDKEEDFAHVLHKVVDRCDVIAGHNKTAVEKSQEAHARAQERAQANADVATAFLSVGFKIQIDSFGRVTFAPEDVSRLLGAIQFEKAVADDLGSVKS